MDAIPQDTPRLLNIADLSRITTLKRSAIYSRIASGEFRPIRLGRRIAFSEAEVSEWVRRQVGKDLA